MFSLRLLTLEQLSGMERDITQFPFHLKTKHDPMLRRLKAAFIGQKQDYDRGVMAQRGRVTNPVRCVVQSVAKALFSLWLH